MSLVLLENDKLKLGRTSFEQLPLICGNIQNVLNDIRQLWYFNSSILRGRVTGQELLWLQVFSFFETTINRAGQEPWRALNLLKEHIIIQRYIAWKHGRWLEKVKCSKGLCYIFYQQWKSYIEQARSRRTQIWEKIAASESIPILTDEENYNLGLLENSLRENWDKFKNYKWKHLFFFSS